MQLYQRVIYEKLSSIINIYNPLQNHIIAIFFVLMPLNINIFAIFFHLVKLEAMIYTGETTSSNEINGSPRIHLYKQRWFMLLIFSMTTFSNAAVFATVRAMDVRVSKYYSIDPDIVNWLENSYILIYVITALPSAYLITKIGLRAAIITASSITTVATCLHFAGCARNGFPFVIAGQIIGAFGVGYILNIPPKIAAEWFGSREQGKAVSIGIFMNFAGTAASVLQASEMVRETSDVNEIGKEIFRLYLSQLIFVTANLVIVYFFFESKPLLPPSYSAALSRNESMADEISFFKSLKMLAGTRHFQYLLHGFCSYFAMCLVFWKCKNLLLKNILSQSNIQWLGFTYVTCGVIGVAISGIINDKFQCYRKLSITIVLGALLSWVGIVILFLFTKFEVAYFLVCGIAGLSSFAFISHGIVQAMEMTYPVPETTVGAIMFGVVELYNFVFVLVLGLFLDNDKIKLVLYVGAGVYFVAFLLVSITKGKLKRQEVERTYSEDILEYQFFT